MKQLSILVALLFSTSAFSYTLSAGMREYFVSPIWSGYGSDAAAKAKLAVFDSGIGSMTMHLRLGVMAPGDSSLFPPVYKSDRNAVEIMVSRINHGNGLAVFKPLVYINPGLGTPSALSEVHPSSVDSLLASYEQMLNTALSIASVRSVQEFVLGAGMGDTLQPIGSSRWKSILENDRKRLSATTELSLELSSESALVHLEEFQKSDPGLFYDTWKDIQRVRFALPLKEYFNPATLVLDEQSLNRLLMDRVHRVRELFPNRKIGLANVLIPGCYGFTVDESEVTCTTHYTDEGLAAQAKGVQSFLDVLDDFKIKSGNALDSVELVVASTQEEPLVNTADPRFMFFNPAVKKLIKDHLSTDTQHSKEVSSPARSSLPEPTNGAKRKLACIYFDELNSKDYLGAIHSRMLDTLVGAFPDWKKERRSVVYFKSHELNDCDTVFYLASNFVLDAPAAFYPELAQFAQSHHVTWFNYKFDRFEKTYKGLPQNVESGVVPLGFDVPVFIQPDAPPTPKNPDTGYFRYFDYKGETFEKLAVWDPVTNILSNNPELGGVTISKPDQVQILSIARHSKTNVATPYAVRQDLTQGKDPLRSGSIFYFADLPFSFTHYEDRYLIFCDVIYDILNEPAPSHGPVALIRLEDINPSIPQEYLNWVEDYLGDRNIPFSMALIPYYSNLFENPDLGNVEPVWKAADLFPGFVGSLRYARGRGAEFVMHGIAHAAGDLISGFAGTSGSDYEFWNWPSNIPLPQDRSDWIIHRLELGEGVLNRLKIKPIAWEVPHYAASALDYLMFGKLFQWNYHRGLYFKSNILKNSFTHSEHRLFDCKTDECRTDRLAKMSELKVDADYSMFGSQIIPYPIFEDTYGQSIIPETLGMVDFAMYSPTTWRPVSYPKDLVRRAKKLRVIRGAMASFFWHPTMLSRGLNYYQEVPDSFDQIGGKHTLMEVVEGLQALGYEFRSIADCDLFPRVECRKNKTN